jgi:hypothetical protein
LKFRTVQEALPTTALTKDGHVDRFRLRGGHLGTKRPREWNVLAGVLLSRPPLLVPEVHPFEQQVVQYQEIIERHQYSWFPVNFFFKKGSIAEKRWRQQNPREPKKSGSGIFRNPEEDSPEWILGGKSDEQVIKSRASNPQSDSKKTVAAEEDELTDEERRDLEQFAAEEELEDEVTELPREINLDLHRLEREPRQTLYCLVKRSRQYHERSGKAARRWGLIEAEAVVEDKVDGLHEVSPGLKSVSNILFRQLAKRSNVISAIGFKHGLWEQILQHTSVILTRKLSNTEEDSF